MYACTLKSLCDTLKLAARSDFEIGGTWRPSHSMLPQDKDCDNSGIFWLLILVAYWSPSHSLTDWHAEIGGRINILILLAFWPKSQSGVLKLAEDHLRFLSIILANKISHNSHSVLILHILSSFYFFQTKQKIIKKLLLSLIRELKSCLLFKFRTSYLTETKYNVTYKCPEFPRSLSNLFISLSSKPSWQKWVGMSNITIKSSFFKLKLLPKINM